MFSGKKKGDLYDLTKPQQAKVTMMFRLQEVLHVHSVVLYFISKEVRKPYKQM